MTFEAQGPSWREKRTVITRNLNPKSLDEKHFRIQEAEYVCSVGSSASSDIAQVDCLYEPSCRRPRPCLRLGAIIRVIGGIHYCLGL